MIAFHFLYLTSIVILFGSRAIAYPLPDSQAGPDSRNLHHPDVDNHSTLFRRGNKEEACEMIEHHKDMEYRAIEAAADNHLIHFNHACEEEVAFHRGQVQHWQKRLTKLYRPWWNPWGLQIRQARLHTNLL